MPDVIVNVEFASLGSPASAPAGSYPIKPSRITMQSNERLRYSVRYVLGTMTVGTSGVAFVQKCNKVGGYIFSPSDDGVHTFTLPFTPTPGHLLVVSLIGYTTGDDPTPTFTLGTVQNGDGTAYTRVGGAGYEAACTNTDTTDPGSSDRQTLSMWYRICVGGATDNVVKFTSSLSSANGAVSLAVMEYKNAASGSPISDNVKTSRNTVDGAGGLSPFTIPALDLNGTTGQMALVVFSNSDAAAVKAPAAYTFRYRSGDVFDPTSQDIDSLQTTSCTAAIMDRSNLSGLGPENPTLTPSGGARNYCGMAIAITR